MLYGAADVDAVTAAARVGKLFLDSIIFFSDFFASRSIPHPMIMYPSNQPFIHPTYSMFATHPSSPPLSFFLFWNSHPPSRVLFLCVFFFLFSFHSNENHLNIIVIFFLASEPTKSLSLSSPHTSPSSLSLLYGSPLHPSQLRPFSRCCCYCWCYPNHMNFSLATPHSTFTFSHTIHIIHKMDGFFSSSCDEWYKNYCWCSCYYCCC